MILFIDFLSSLLYNLNEFGEISVIDIILDTLLDGLKLLPFLFVTFIIIELIEHKLSDKNRDLISKSGKYGPVIGSMLGLIPQCGFSVMATNLYITRIVSLGTLISIYLSTSDEMLPILLSQNVDFALIIKILSIKFFVGMTTGIIIDFILRKTRKQKIKYELCNEEHCHCEKGIILSSLIHTIKTLMFIILISFVINILFEFFGSEYLSTIFLKDTVFAPFITSLIGLIPNCGASVAITQLYLESAISFGSLISGLLTVSGVAVLVLFKSNKNIKENLNILFVIYGVGVLTGIIIQLIEYL